MSNGAPETPETRAQEVAAIRRRWITLGEVIAVLAVSISGLTLYLNWADRQDERAEKAAQSSEASSRSATLVLNVGTVNDKRMTLRPTDPDQIVQSQGFIFPRALNVRIEATSEPRIEARWFENALKAARKNANLPDDSVGDERLPVAITTKFVVGDKNHETTALYDIGYGISGRMIAGHDVALRGLSFVGTVKTADVADTLEDRWTYLITH